MVVGVGELMMEWDQDILLEDGSEDRGVLLSSFPGDTMRA